MSHCSTGRDDRPRDLFATGRSRSTSAAIVRSMFGPGTSNATHSSSRRLRAVRRLRPRGRHVRRRRGAPSGRRTCPLWAEAIRRPRLDRSGGPENMCAGPVRERTCSTRQVVGPANIASTQPTRRGALPPDVSGAASHPIARGRHHVSSGSEHVRRPPSAVRATTGPSNPCIATNMSTEHGRRSSASAGPRRGCRSAGSMSGVQRSASAGRVGRVAKTPHGQRRASSLRLRGSSSSLRFVESRARAGEAGRPSCGWGSSRASWASRPPAR